MARPARRWLATALAAGALACAGRRETAGPPPELLEWAAGPARWYLLPTELRAVREIGTQAEALNFIERFWRLRDPDPGTPDNPLREAFASRVEAADLLYSEGGARGALTPRGRALILLGPPAHLQVTTEPVLTWRQGKGRERVVSREVQTEIWRYPLASLPERFAAALRAQGLEDGALLRFHLEAGGTRLVEGEELLELAAKVAVVPE